MSGVKKLNSTFEDPVNAKIQRKFDSVFDQKSAPSTTAKSDDSGIFDGSISFNTSDLADENFIDKKSTEKPKIDLDFSSEDSGDVMSETKPKPQAAPKANDDGLDFSIDFDLDAPIERTGDSSSAPAAPVEVQAKESVEATENDAGFSLDDSDIVGDVEFDEATRKTVVIDRASFTKSDLETFTLEKTSDSATSSADLMSTEEARTNIESTIKDILRPKIDQTKELDLNEMGLSESPMDEIEDSVLDFSKTPSKGFVLAEISDTDFSIGEDSNTQTNAKFEPDVDELSSGLDLGELEEKSDSFSLDDEEVDIDYSAQPDFSKSDSVIDDEPVFNTASVTPEIVKEVPREVSREISREVSRETSREPSMPTMNTDDSIRFQATIRALREEREEMLGTIKSLKGENKELEQDNLTLKANLDEAKIEITILRKRHMVELEDMKYRLGLSEEKKAMSIELARQADLRREKLEQKVRIDFNQVKQREKELESKLELLSMDVDSQVQSREHKILELRRKIDALEFNMENASIKEQKSLDDKRKLEDRLNKIMKTLRHSIKNLEDDIDHMEDDGDQQKDKI